MRRLMPLLLVVITLAACGAATTAPISPNSTSAAATAPTASSSPVAGKPAIYPIFVSSEILAGPNRFLFALTDAANKLVAAPDVPVALEFFDVAADENAVAFTEDARFVWAVPDLRGLYAADVEFPTAGRWGVRFTATFPDGRQEQVRADFDVAEAGPTLAIGAPAVPIDTPTAADVGGNLAKVSTDTEPDPAFYRTSVEDALAAKQPFVLVFATPAFCQTAMCGPILENVKAAAADYPTLTFINAEPYKMAFTEGRLQPELDAAGNLEAAAWTDAWGLRTEPWIFVVDGEGRVTAKFEAAVGEEELRATLDAVAPTTGSVEGLVTAVDQASVSKVNAFHVANRRRRAARVRRRQPRPHRRGLQRESPSRAYGDEYADPRGLHGRRWQEGRRAAHRRGVAENRSPVAVGGSAFSRASRPRGSPSRHPEQERQRATRGDDVSSSAAEP